MSDAWVCRWHTFCVLYPVLSTPVSNTLVCRGFSWEGHTHTCCVLYPALSTPSPMLESPMLESVEGFFLRKSSSASHWLTLNFLPSPPSSHRHLCRSLWKDLHRLLQEAAWLHLWPTPTAPDNTEATLLPSHTPSDSVPSFLKYINNKLSAVTAHLYIMRLRRKKETWPSIV